MAATDTNINPTVAFNSYTSIYSVLCDGLTIETTVTHKAKTVEEWVQLVTSKYGETQVVGLDTEWMMSDINKKMTVAILQLCVEDKCLIFQLCHMDEIPQSLRTFMKDSNFNFVGVGVGLDINKLKNEYGLECTKGIDVSTMAMKLWPGRFSSRGLKCLAKELVGLNMKKSKDVCTSEWRSKELTEAQVEYACIDAYASYKIGHQLRIENNGVLSNPSQ